MMIDWLEHDLVVIPSSDNLPQIYLVELVSNNVIRFRDIATGELFGMPPVFLTAMLQEKAVHLRLLNNFQCEVLTQNPTTQAAIDRGWTPETNQSPYEWLLLNYIPDPCYDKKYQKEFNDV